MLARKLTSAALSLWLGWSAVANAQEPAKLPMSLTQDASGNQELADDVARALKSHTALRGYHIDIEVEAGVVELSGIVADGTQREEAVRLARDVKGVKRVVDRLDLPGGNVMRTQAPPVPLLPIPGVDNKKDAWAPPPQPVAPLAPQAPIAPAVPPSAGAYGPYAGGLPEPLPIFQANPAVPNPQMQPPPMPPYAWPSYAPYNNWGRIAYPNVYQYDQFPFIGPFYPYPKVPLGWRSVKLTWEDGWWWFGREPTGHDWWRIRYY
jgi:hypothetical protein